MKKYFLWIFLVGLVFSLKAQEITIQADNEREFVAQKRGFDESGKSNINVVCANPVGLGVYGLLSTSANLVWYGSVQNVLFEVQYKPTTSSSWITITDILSSGTNGGISLSNLLPNTTYEWKVKTICGINDVSNFVIGDNFTTTCPKPGGFGVFGILSTSANLVWYGSEQNVLFELQYKPVTASTWTVITDISSNGSNGSISLTNLLPNTIYQWKVKTICSSGNPSDFGVGDNFTTICPLPKILETANLLSTSIKLRWYCDQQYATFELQYKPITSSTWTTVSDIQSDNDGYGRNNELVDISNLLPNTTYQWRVKTNCASGDPSFYVNGTNFTTVCPLPYFLETANLLSTSIKLRWSCDQQYAAFELQYKPITSSTWTTVSDIQSDNDGYGRNNELVDVSNLLPNTTYQWRVKTVCTLGTPSIYVNGTNFTTVCPLPYFLETTNLLSTSVKLRWYCDERYANFELQYKPITSSTWTTVSDIQSDSDGYGRNNELVDISNLLPNTTYQWKVKTICASGSPSVFVNGTNFTTLCAAPTGLGNGNVTITSADLIWLSVSGGISYEVRYRVQGSNTAWTTQTVNAPTVTPNSTVIYAISGLSSQTSYEWQVRTICTPLNTAFSTLATFTTACPVPTNLNTTEITTNSAKLNWNQGLVGSTTDLQWRLVGSNTWTTITGITTNFYTLTGLSVGGNYQWQVRSNCSPTVSSSYATPISFTAACPLPTNLIVANLLPISVQLNWSGGYAGGTYSVQWRQQGSNTWTTINNISALPYTLTGLTAGTIYEWQVKLLCTPTVTTAYAGPSTFTTPTVCSSMYSIKNGSWNDPTVWSCSRIPNTTDIVLIKHIITVPVGYTAQAQQITYDQGPTVKFLQSAQLNFLR